jgi:hypothetical protein
MRDTLHKRANALRFVECYGSIAIDSSRHENSGETQELTVGSGLRRPAGEHLGRRGGEQRETAISTSLYVRRRVRHQDPTLDSGVSDEVPTRW